MGSQVSYTVETIRSGQPRAYADTENEYRITVQRNQRPWLMYGELEKRIAEEEGWRKEGKMMGGTPPDVLRKERDDWAKKIARSLCQNFREKNDDDGRTGMDAHFYPTLKWMKLDDKAGTIHVLIIEPFTD